MSAAATPARADFSTSGIMVRAASSDSLFGGAELHAARTAATAILTITRLLDFIPLTSFISDDLHSGSALCRRAAFSLLTQRVQAREHFIRGLPRISTLRLGDCKLGVQVRLRSHALRLLLLAFRQCALRSVELLARL